MAYDIRRVGRRLTIDGDLSKPEWARAQKSSRFVDMADGTPGWYDTRAAALWDDQALYIAFWVEDPYPRARLTERDSIIFSESDIEVFLDFGDAYYEFELNALNTVYEVLFIWQDAYDRFDPKEFDLREALSFGGNFDRDEASFWTGTHPRGNRWAFRDWDWTGLETAVQVQGNLNDDARPSRGWTAEIKLPWTGMSRLGPKPGVSEEWRIFFGRFQKMRMNGGAVNPAWCWTPHGLYDTHMPEKFTLVRLVDSN